jgi:hypothetical protein
MGGTAPRNFAGHSMLCPYETVQRMEQALPANTAGMDQHAGVRFKPDGRETRAPDVIGVRRVDRHINDQRRTDDVGARHEAPETAVARIISIVAHHEIFAGRHHDFAVHHVIRKIVGPLLRHAAIEHADARRRIIFHHGRLVAVGVLRVWLAELRTVDEHLALHDFYVVAGQANAALDKIRIALFGQRRAEHDDLLPLRIAP